ncbi:hypothetical protein Trydic_g20119 [Trypoxylus dichotomus]
MTTTNVNRDPYCIFIDAAYDGRRQHDSNIPSVGSDWKGLEEIRRKTRLVTRLYGLLATHFAEPASTSCIINKPIYYPCGTRKGNVPPEMGNVITLVDWAVFIIQRRRK